MDLWTLILAFIALWLAPAPPVVVAPPAPVVVVHSAPAPTHDNDDGSPIGGFASLPPGRQNGTSPAPVCPPVFDPMNWPQGCPVPPGV